MVVVWKRTYLNMISGDTRKNITMTGYQDKLINHWTFDYDSENNITTLQQQTGQGEQAILHYRYDTLNNLTAMICKGSSGLPLCPRDTAFSGSGFRQAPIIVRQELFFYTFKSYRSG